MTEFARDNNVPVKTDYISREEAIEAIGEMPLNWTDSPEELQEVADWEEHLHAIMAVPAADVRPVVRGEWIKSPECPEEYDICSVCGLNDKHRTRGNAEHPAFESIPPFCKWCGADMRKEKEHER